jgi:hypothetical protein
VLSSVHFATRSSLLSYSLRQSRLWNDKGTKRRRDQLKESSEVRKRARQEDRTSLGFSEWRSTGPIRSTGRASTTWLGMRVQTQTCQSAGNAIVQKNAVHCRSEMSDVPCLTHLASAYSANDSHSIWNAMPCFGTQRLPRHWRVPQDLNPEHE